MVHVIILMVAMTSLSVVTWAGKSPRCCAKEHVCAAVGDDDDKWVVVFRMSAGIGPSGYHYYRNRDMTDDISKLYFSCGHYRSNLVNLWDCHNIAEVKLSVWKDGEEKAFVVFDGKGTTANTWFNKDKILRSSWTDIKGGSKRVFSFEGHFRRNSRDGDVTRRWAMIKSYNGCPKDIGWLVVLEGSDPCPWAQGGPYPKILFSTTTTSLNYLDGKIARADSLTVSVKFA